MKENSFLGVSDFICVYSRGGWQSVPSIIPEKPVSVTVRTMIRTVSGFIEKMVLDRRLPECRAFFTEVSTPAEIISSYRPVLRKQDIEKLTNEALAKAWLDYLRRNESAMDPVLLSMLFLLLNEVLGRSLCSRQ